MLTKEGHLVLVDFGSAKKLDGKARTSTFIGASFLLCVHVCTYSNKSLRQTPLRQNTT